MARNVTTQGSARSQGFGGVVRCRLTRIVTQRAVDCIGGHIAERHPRCFTSAPMSSIWSSSCSLSKGLLDGAHLGLTVLVDRQARSFHICE